MSDEEIAAMHCLGMCADWSGHPAYQGEDDAGLRQFLIDCAEGLRWQRDEIARLREALGEIARLGNLIASDLRGRVEAGKVMAVQRMAEEARAALAGETR